MMIPHFKPHIAMFKKVRFFKKRKIIKRENDTPYLIRWNLFECPAFSVKLHKILRSDYDCLHDHPWSFISIILWGGYVEHRDKVICEHWSVDDSDERLERTSKIYHPGNILYRRAEDRHKLEIHQPAWTLVISFKKKRQWGFWTKAGWVPFFKYNSDASCE
jgi:hypothetical protein